MVASATWTALGTTAAVFVTRPQAIGDARALLELELDRTDRTCSRFRPDSELVRVNAQAGESVPVSDGFAAALAVALEVAEATDGAVDPTMGQAMRNIGYDRDFSALCPELRVPAAASAPGAWRRVTLDRGSRRLRAPQGVELDLGATAKALAADRASECIADALGCGVLVNLGGDIAVAGSAPESGWRIRVCDDHADTDPAAGENISIVAGGLATSSTTVRRWRAEGRELHHIVDPQTGMPARVVWRTASVAAHSCVAANAASTAAIVRGSGAPRWLRDQRLPSRLVAPCGDVVRIAGWPSAEAS